MNLKRARVVIFAVLLTLFSANYFLWGFGMISGISDRELINRHSYLFPLSVISQYLHVYDAPYFFYSQNQVHLIYADGRESQERITYNSFHNPLDALFFFHVWYWRGKNFARKDQLMRLRFCRPGVKSVEWKVRYLEGTSKRKMGRTDC